MNCSNLLFSELLCTSAGGALAVVSSVLVYFLAVPACFPLVCVIAWFVGPLGWGFVVFFCVSVCFLAVFALLFLPWFLLVLTCVSVYFLAVVYLSLLLLVFLAFFLSLLFLLLSSIFVFLLVRLLLWYVSLILLPFVCLFVLLVVAIFAWLYPVVWGRWLLVWFLTNFLSFPPLPLLVSLTGLPYALLTLC